MKKTNLLLLVGMATGSLYSAYTPQTYQLPFQFIKKLSNGDTIGWVQVPKYRDNVLVNIGKHNTALYYPNIGGKNYMYISPDAPTVALPRGLYYWGSQWISGIPPVIGKKGQRSKVRNHPRAKNFWYDSKKRAYVDTHTGSSWDAKDHRHDPF